LCHFTAGTRLTGVRSFLYSKQVAAHRPSRPQGYRTHLQALVYQAWLQHNCCVAHLSSHTNSCSLSCLPVLKCSHLCSPWPVLLPPPLQALAAAAPPASRMQAEAVATGAEASVSAPSGAAASVIHLFRRPFLSAAAAVSLLKTAQEKVSASIVDLNTEQCYNVEVEGGELSKEESGILTWLPGDLRARVSPRTPSLPVSTAVL